MSDMITILGWAFLIAVMWTPFHSAGVTWKILAGLFHVLLIIVQRLTISLKPRHIAGVGDLFANFHFSTVRRLDDIGFRLNTQYKYNLLLIMCVVFPVWTMRWYARQEFAIAPDQVASCLSRLRLRIAMDDMLDDIGIGNPHVEVGDRLHYEWYTRITVMYQRFKAGQETPAGTGPWPCLVPPNLN